MKATVCALGVYYKPTDSHSYLLYSSSHSSQVKNSIPFSHFFRLRRSCSDDSDFSEKSEAMCHVFDKRGYPVLVVQAGHHRAQQCSTVSSHYKRLRREILIAFHSLSHFTLTTTLLNTSFSKTLKYLKTIQRLVLSFCNLHQFNSNVTKTQATFWTKVHFKPITNLELSNALA